MVWIGCALVIGFVTRIAIGGHGRVVVIHVAIRARCCSVRSGQWERSVVVVEGGLGPGGRAVTQLALLRESRSHVIGIGGPVEIGQMAT